MKLNFSFYLSLKLFLGYFTLTFGDQSQILAYIPTFFVYISIVNSNSSGVGSNVGNRFSLLGLMIYQPLYVVHSISFQTFFCKGI